MNKIWKTYWKQDQQQCHAKSKTNKKSSDNEKKNSNLSLSLFYFRNSLPVQWLGLQAFTAGGPGSIPDHKACGMPPKILNLKVNK